MNTQVKVTSNLFQRVLLLTFSEKNKKMKQPWKSDHVTCLLTVLLNGFSLHVKSKLHMLFYNTIPCIVLQLNPQHLLLSSFFILSPNPLSPHSKTWLFPSFRSQYKHYFFGNYLNWSLSRILWFCFTLKSVSISSCHITNSLKVRSLKSHFIFSLSVVWLDGLLV